jgi:hypothetical protein
MIETDVKVTPTEDEVGRETRIAATTPNPGAEDKRAQRAAVNRVNAKKSTGPRSVHGQKIARRNALQHGQTATTLLAEKTTDNIFVSIVARLREEYCPSSLEEEFLIETIAMQWSRLSFSHEWERKSAADRLFGSDALDRFLRYNALSQKTLFSALERLNAILEKEHSEPEKQEDGTIETLQ